MRGIAERRAARAPLVALLAILLLSGCGARAEVAEQDASRIQLNATLSVAEIRQIIAEVRRVDSTAIVAIIDGSTGGAGIAAEQGGVRLLAFMSSPVTSGPNMGTVHVLERRGRHWVVVETKKTIC